VAFAKKLQVGGIMAGRRVELVPDNVFTVSSRINSTWGGGLVDMVRSRRLLEIIESEHMFDAAARRGDVLLGGLHDLGLRHPELVSNVRGRGLMCAIDLPDGAVRDQVIAGLRDEQVLALPCGELSVRFRPALSVTEDELGIGMAALHRVLSKVPVPTREREPA
jgi:L-lysine 6-transaminase